MILQDCLIEPNQKDEINTKLVSPGTAYLRIMQYYTEEKEYNKLPNSFQTWENFIEKYFSEDVEMTVKVYDKDDLFYEISKYFIKLDSSFDNLPYVYFHKNKNLFNKWIFIDKYTESLDKDEDSNLCKMIDIKDALNVFEYKTNKIFIHFDAVCKFDSDLKFQNVFVNISNIEIYDEINSKNLNLFELKSTLFSLYSNFKSFLEVLYMFIFRVLPVLFQIWTF